MDYEIILVDDGSTDNSAIICDNYSNRDERVKVLHRKNSGPSSARNAGIDIAKGEYIIFLDSDDFWDDIDALKNIEERLNESKADVLVFPAKRYYEINNRFTNIVNYGIDRKRIAFVDKYESIEYMLENNIYKAAAWNKVVRRSIIDEHKMRFTEGYLSEDLDWCGDLLLYSNQFDFYENPLYCYRQQRTGSITKINSEKLIKDKIYMCKKGYVQAKSCSDKKMGELLAAYYAYEYAVLLGISAGIKDKLILEDMKSLSVLLDYDICNKVKKVKKLQKLLGYSLTRRILCLFVRTKKYELF